VDQYLDDDFVVLRRDDGSTWEHYWGDRVERDPVGDQPGKLRVQMRGQHGRMWGGFIAAKAKLRDRPILRFSMVDVQQGDGMIMETPGGKVLFIDGGDIKLFARHAAARFPGTTAENPLIVDAIVVTHGDADHFAGLTEIWKSEGDERPHKRLFIAPRRILHNGLVKRPGSLAGGGSRPEEGMFGAHVEVDGEVYATGLVDDPRTVPAVERNKFFNEWCEALDAWGARTLAVTGQPMIVRRVDHLRPDAFDFLADDGVHTNVFGPISEPVDGAAALRYFRTPPKDDRLMLGTAPAGRGRRRAPSASHTVNGHSINLRLRLGNVRFLLTGDLNQESMALIRANLPDMSLSCDILKAPHHGSADFDMNFLLDAAPVVTLVSSGDESVAKEHIHPRATLMAALGKASRTTPAVLFSTELAAFFAYRGASIDQVPTQGQSPRFDGFERLNYGIIHIRTDGERVLAFTHSGERGLNEAYRFSVDPAGKVEFAAQASKCSAPKKA
jgi:beta-lactamase superfamily II metal-dependent hydrolase